jgi:hypothetical protein
MDDAKTTENVLGDLIAKRDAHVKRGAKLATDHGAIAYAANTGDQAARKKLDALNHETALHQSELENLTAAIEEATKRIDAARREDAGATARANASEARKIWAEVVQDLYAAHEANVAATAKVNEAYAKLRKIHTLGAKFPTAQQFVVHGELVAYTSLMLTPWHREFRHLSPHEKRTWKTVLEGSVDAHGVKKDAGWTVLVENQLRELLGKFSESSKDAAA